MLGCFRARSFVQSKGCRGTVLHPVGNSSFKGLSEYPSSFDTLHLMHFGASEREFDMSRDQLDRLGA